MDIFVTRLNRFGFKSFNIFRWVQSLINLIYEWGKLSLVPTHQQLETVEHNQMLVSMGDADGLIHGKHPQYWFHGVIRSGRFWGVLVPQYQCSSPRYFEAQTKRLPFCRQHFLSFFEIFIVVFWFQFHWSLCPSVNYDRTLEVSLLY